jgi:DNA-binding IclR family transcriptional regulator
MDRSGEPEKLVGALSNGIAIIRYLNKIRRPVGVSQITHDLHLNMSTCYNLLKTLVYEDLLAFDSNNKTYALSLGLVQLAKSTLDQASSVRLIRPHIEGITVKHQVTVTLWQCISNDRVVLVDRADTDSAITVHMQIGQRLPLYIGALGRCMAAYSTLDKAGIEKQFRTLQWQSPPTFAEYWNEVKAAKANGFAIDSGNYVKGVTTISSIVLDKQNKPTMAISAVGFSAQFNDETLNALGCDLCDHTQQISRALAGDFTG